MRIILAVSIILFVSISLYCYHLMSYIINFEKAFYLSNYSTYFISCTNHSNLNAEECKKYASLYLEEITPRKK